MFKTCLIHDKHKNIYSWTGKISYVHVFLIIGCQGIKILVYICSFDVYISVAKWTIVYFKVLSKIWVIIKRVSDNQLSVLISNLWHIYFNLKVFINIKRHVFYFTVEPAIAKKQILNEECAQLMENTTNDRPEIIKGMNATDNQHLRFFRVYSYFILF